MTQTQSQPSELSTLLEARAKIAQDFEAFNSINLSGIKRFISEVLELFGRNNIFDEYTKHNISHVNKMLNIAEWLIPDSTKAIMSPADSLMLTLSIYFHDLGLIVTKEEFDNRGNSGFSKFVNDNLYHGKEGEDYKAEIFKLYPDLNERDKFLYQEFVRNNHADRIRYWIQGILNDELGITASMVGEINKLLDGLPIEFRNDLALVCKSHHDNDLDKTDKYSLSQPYGDSEEETANVQYAAVILRTADLLHITKDRTPSIQYRLINPQNPKSQEEWAKQNAVTRVRAKKKLNNDESEQSFNEQPDTIEVFARFTNAEGYFGLTTYLIYAQSELKLSRQWIEKARTEGAGSYSFPWITIDRSHVFADGFLTNQFSFSIDQEKILNLLTGHTLYNDSNVVVRELIQNSIDAIRLQNYINTIDKFGDDYNYSVRITWDSVERVLTIEDDGSGMSQAIIENHFLKAGSSRYQDKQFKEQYPAFNSISRFGIGVLSCFMISDEVEVYTSHIDDEEARHLMLRSVHGNYLISLINKSDPRVSGIKNHGTRISIRLRPSAGEFKVSEIVKFWALFPACEVKLKIDDTEEMKIGYSEPSYALKEYLNSIGIIAFIEGEEKTGIYKIKRYENDGISLAYTVKWSQNFKEWTFLTMDSLDSRRRASGVAPFATCIEGIRVESGTPGFSGLNIAAVANITGRRAPKTNVARSSIESTPEQENLLREIYSAYGRHITSEIDSLLNDKNFSLTWATEEAKYILPPLNSEAGDRIAPLKPNILREELQKLQVLLVDLGEERKRMSIDELELHNSFWIIDWDFTSSLNNMLKNAPISLSMQHIVRDLSDVATALPEDIVLANGQNLTRPYSYAFENREIDKIKIFTNFRRIDLRWSKADREQKKWTTLDYTRRPYMNLGRMDINNDPNFRNIWYIYVATEAVEFEGLEDYLAIKTNGNIYFSPNTEINKIIKYFIDIYNNSEQEDLVNEAFISMSYISNSLNYGSRFKNEDIVKYFANRFDMMPTQATIDALEKLQSLGSISIFDTSAWRRNKNVPGSGNYDYEENLY